MTRKTECASEQNTIKMSRLTKCLAVARRIMEHASPYIFHIALSLKHISLAINNIIHRNSCSQHSRIDSPNDAHGASAGGGTLGALLLEVHGRSCPKGELDHRCCSGERFLPDLNTNIVLPSLPSVSSLTPSPVPL